MTEPPGEAGYRLPAEFEEHEATWMAWPHDPRTWVAGLEAAEDAFLAMIEAVSQGERVDLMVRPEDRERAEDRLTTRNLGQVRLHEKDHADAWLRDTGPTVLVRGEERIAVDWLFDAWGGKYEDLKRDDDVAAFVASQTGLPRYRVDEVCEGGALDTNGTGTILTTASCLIDGRGHPSKEHVEELFERVLGASAVRWLPGGLAGDDTDGHIDTLARFVAEDTIAVAVSSNPEDTDHETLQHLRTGAGVLGDEHGDAFEVVELPQPAPVEAAGQRRPASYANFYVANEAVLLPTFGDPQDPVARKRLNRVFEERRIVDVPARPLVAGYGACHCLTQQIPAPDA